jgi:hypothetical protein
MNIWYKRFNPTYVRADGVRVLKDSDIPLPDGFVPVATERAQVMFPPGTRAGDHFHQKREEVFVGFGEGMELLVEDPESKEVKVWPMGPEKNEGKLTCFGLRPECHTR